jgi:threonine dehydratase
VPTEVASAAVPRGAAADDWLDALAALVVAEHLARGAGRPFPDPPEADDHGITAAIWSFIPGELPG